MKPVLTQSLISTGLMEGLISDTASAHCCSHGSCVSEKGWIISVELLECLLVWAGQKAQQDPVSSTLSAENADALQIKAQMFSNCRFRRIITEVKTTRGAENTVRQCGNIKSHCVPLTWRTRMLRLHSSVIARPHYCADFWPAGIQTWHVRALCSDCCSFSVSLWTMCQLLYSQASTHLFFYWRIHHIWINVQSASQPELSYICLKLIRSITIYCPCMYFPSLKDPETCKYHRLSSRLRHMTLNNLFTSVGFSSLLFIWILFCQSQGCHLLSHIIMWPPCIPWVLSLSSYIAIQCTWWISFEQLKTTQLEMTDHKKNIQWFISMLLFQYPFSN